MDLINNRQIRVFVSSTFRDMVAERDYLVGKIFPRLRAYCIQRNVEFIELDLRWGITEKEAQSGKVAEICLREIERTRPFFIGLLGERYGWMPSLTELKHNPVLFDNFNWVREDMKHGLSITEMEMQFGVLRLQQPINAFFFLRDKGVEVPAEFREEPGSDAEKKLKRLKEKIVQQTTYPASNYTSEEDLGNQILIALTNLIDRLFPEQEMTELDLQQHLHASFFRSLIPVYIPESKNYTALDNFLAGNKQFFTIQGESGSGKSALLANWINERKDTHTIIYHSLGISRESTEEDSISRRLDGEIRKYLTLSSALNEWSIKKTLTEALAETKLKGINLVLILDGLDKLKSLSWLPELPSNVKLISTTLPNDYTRENMEKRGSEIYSLSFPDRVTRSQIIVNYLAYYGKTLEPEMIEMILNDEKTRNPLILRALLEELRVFGIHEKVRDHIQHYLSTPNQQAFFDCILERMEQEYNLKDDPFVERVLSFIFVSRDGLSEKELIDLSGIAPVYWSQLYNAFSLHLVSLNGFVTFSNTIRNSVELRYLTNQEKIKTYRKKIISYFESQQNCKEKNLLYYEQSRINKEIPWQYFQLDNWNSLYNYVLSFDVIDNMYFYDRSMLAQYWTALEKQGYSIEDYLTLDTVDIDPKLLGNKYDILSLFCDSTLRHEMALLFAVKELDIHRKEKDEERKRLQAEGKKVENYFIRRNLIRVANLSVKCRKFDNARQLYEEAKEEMEEVNEFIHTLSKEQQDGFRLEYADFLNYMGVFYDEIKQFHQSEKVFTEALELINYLLENGYRENDFVLKKCALVQGNLAGAFRKTGQTDKAYNTYQNNIETIQRLIQIDPDRYESREATSLHDLAVLQSDEGENVLAEENYLKALTIWRPLVKKHPSYIPSMLNTLTGLGAVYVDLEQYEKAETILLEAQYIIEHSKTLNSQVYLDLKYLTLSKLGQLYRYWEKFDLAEQYYPEALKVARQLYEENTVYTSELSKGLAHSASFYGRMGKITEAESLYMENIPLLESLAWSDPDTYYKHYDTVMSNFIYLYKQCDRKEDALKICCLAIGVSNTIYKAYGKYLGRNPYILQTIGSFYKNFEQITGATFQTNHYEGNKIVLESLLSKSDENGIYTEYIEFLYDRMVQNAITWSTEENKARCLSDTCILLVKQWQLKPQFNRFSQLISLKYELAKFLDIRYDEERQSAFLEELVLDIQALNLNEKAKNTVYNNETIVNDYISLIYSLMDMENRFEDVKKLHQALLPLIIPILNEACKIAKPEVTPDNSDEFQFSLSITQEYISFVTS